MKSLDLYSAQTEINDRMLSHITPGITDRRFIELEIQKWIASPERRQQITGDEYYRGKQDILKRRRTAIGENGELQEVRNLPNNRVVDNQYAKMVDQKANYICGKPITFDVKNSEYGAALAKVFGKHFQRTMRIVAERALTGGKAWVYPYYTDSGDLSLAVLPAHEVLPFWSDTDHTELDCAVHLYPVYVYDPTGCESIIEKVEVYHAGGVDRFIWDSGSLKPDNDAASGAYVTAVDSRTQKQRDLNWAKIPLVCFKASHTEAPLLNRVKCLQDALNLMLSNYVNSMEEDVRNTVLVIHNYDGEDLGEFRRNLATYGAVKVRTMDGSDGAVDTLEIAVNSDNCKAIIDLLKKTIIENAMGYDAKDERMSGTPNQMNIQSMYSDIDLDANGMETEFQAAFEDLLFFVNAHLANTGVGNYDGEEVAVIFNRDILINEGEAIDNCGKSRGIISDETILKQHPWVDDPEKELERLRAEKEQAVSDMDEYRQMFADTGGDRRNNLTGGTDA